MGRSRDRLTYRDAGVDIGAADRFVATIARLASQTHGPEVISGVGPFAAAVRIPRSYKNPVLLSSADGVGTKLNIARLSGRHDTIGIDLVAMNVNDLLTAGARPLFFLDYLSMGNLRSIDAEALVAGIAQGCKQANASLVGGETAEMPGAYEDGDYDLAGFCVGVAERRKIVDGRRIRPGNLIVGLASNGLHSNGYSLARKALAVTDKRSLRRRLEGSDTNLGQELLRPTIIYVRPVLAALGRFAIKGMAHITGGGLPGNLSRALPDTCDAVVRRQAIPRLAIFEAIQKQGNISRREMDRTFNCGIGYTMIVGAKQAEDLCSFLRRRRIGAHIIGRIEEGRGRVRYAPGR
ncbi:MAG: phosphoribosylformylglycinamidine cyclo-ligase [Deltaproteobacteria bacterium]